MTRLSPGNSTIPRFCDRCQRPGKFGVTLCELCGDTLQPEGYCDICEGFLRSPIGSLCPKHDVKLTPPPPPPEPLGVPGEDVRLVTIETYANSHEANAAQIRLEAEGIRTFLDGERMGSQSLYQVATGGIRLQVPDHLAAEARVLLRQSWDIPALEDDLEDAFEDLAPPPGEGRREVMRLAILLFLFGPLLLALIATLFR